MADANPPTYQSLGDVADFSPSAPSINEAYVPYEDEEGPSICPGKESEISKSSEELATIAKPPTAPVLELLPHEIPIVVTLPALTEEQIREITLDYVAQHCCYGSKFVKQMVIPQILNGSVLHYRLESLGERRQTSQKFTGYYGQTIDGPENGAPPDPWEIVVTRPLQFADSFVHMEVPHTAFVKQCNRCDGTGKITCPSCYGSGRQSCSSCSGSGRNSDDERCNSCGGSGSESCWRCSGSGKVECPRCDGYGKLKWFTRMTVTWKNHREEFMTDTAELPREKIMSGQGKFLFQEEGKTVLPVCNAPDATVNIASTRLVERHSRGFPNELTLKQRHWLRAVPFTRVRYGWKTKVGEFYVYGFEKHVHFQDYPQPCCCCTCL